MDIKEDIDTESLYYDTPLPQYHRTIIRNRFSTTVH